MSLIFHLFFLCLILSMTSCAGKSDYHFKDSADALKQYRDFHHSIAEEHQANAEKLSDFICSWQELSDTVYNYIKKDTSPYRGDTELDPTKKKAVTFFAALDKQPLFNKGYAREKIALYRDFLATTKEHGITNQKELLSFLETEDRHFRTFLSNIGDYTDVGLQDVTKMTEQICTDIFRNASEKRLTSEDAMVYMGMRTCRRLLLNAKVCEDLIKAGKIKSESQANAYLWMTLQPFLSMDAFAISMLTEAQQKQMTELAAAYPVISERLAAKGYAAQEQLAHKRCKILC